MHLMIIAIVGLSIAITIANMPPREQPEGTFSWSRTEHQLDETNSFERENNIIEVFYNQESKPYFRAMYKDGSDYAFQLGVDMDQDHIIDFTIMDCDGDHLLDFDMIFCHENCDEAMRRALLLFQGKLILEKTI